MLLVFMAVSCSGESVNELPEDVIQIMDIRYKVIVDRSVISNISYRDATGQMVDAVEEYQSILAWAKDQTVQLPFEARVKVDFGGTANVPVHYDLYIYADGVEARHQEGLVPSNGSATMIYDFLEVE
jgi:hypothetical protein